MTGIEKASAYTATAVFLVGIGISWNTLNNRIDKVDEKIGAIQKTLGSTTCNAILTRQIEAIEKNRAEPRKALETLSSQYDCVPHNGDAALANYSAVNVSAAMNAVEAHATNLTTQLNAIDAQLNSDR